MMKRLVAPIHAILLACCESRCATRGGIVPSLLGFEAKEHALPKEESMPVVSVLEQLFYHLPFTQ
jgi:hypothetical protein